MSKGRYDETFAGEDARGPVDGIPKRIFSKRKVDFEEKKADDKHTKLPSRHRVTRIVF